MQDYHGVYRLHTRLHVSYTYDLRRREARGRSVSPWLPLAIGYARWGVSILRLLLARASLCRLRVPLRLTSCGH